MNLEDFIIQCMCMLSLHTDCTDSMFTQYMQKTEEFQQQSPGLQPKQQGQMLEEFPSEVAKLEPTAQGKLSLIKQLPPGM